MDISQFVQDVVHLASAFAPVRRPRSARGRVRIVSWEERIAHGVTGAKLTLPALSVAVLLQDRVLTLEQGLAVVAYAAQHVKELDVTACLPSSSKWVVREALKEIGFAGADSVMVNFEDMLDVASALGKQVAENKKAEMARKAEGKPVSEPTSVLPLSFLDAGLLTGFLKEKPKTAPGDRATSKP